MEKIRKKQRWKIKNSKGIHEEDEQEVIEDKTTSLGACWHQTCKYIVQSWMEEISTDWFWVGHVHWIRGEWRNINSFHGNSSLYGEGDERTLI